VLAGVHLVAARRHLLGVRAGQRDRRALRLDLLAERVETRLRGVERRPRLVRFLRRGDLLVGEALGAAEDQPRVLEVGGGRLRLRFGCR
jgi:hypothetical protein